MNNSQEFASIYFTSQIKALNSAVVKARILLILKRFVLTNALYYHRKTITSNKLTMMKQRCSQTFKANLKGKSLIKSQWNEQRQSSSTKLPVDSLGINQSLTPDPPSCN